MSGGDVTVGDARDLGALIPAALDDFGLSLSEFRVYCRIARRAGRDGVCWESVTNEAKAIGVGAKTVKRARHVLEMAGMIRVERRFGQTSNITLRPVSEWGDPASLEGWRERARNEKNANRGPSEPRSVRSSPPGTEETQVPGTEETHEGSPQEGSPTKAGGDTSPRGRDELFEQVAGACGIDWRDGLTKSARGALNRAVKELREVGATPDEVARRASRFRRRYAGADLTPSALTKHWPSLVDDRPDDSRAVNEGSWMGKPAPGWEPDGEAARRYQERDAGAAG